MTVVAARRSSRRSMVVEAPALMQKKSRRSLPAPPVASKKPIKRLIKEVAEEAITKKSRSRVVKLLKLQEANGDFKPSDMATPVKLSKNEKALLLTKKSGNKAKKP